MTRRIEELRLTIEAMDGGYAEGYKVRELAKAIVTLRRETPVATALAEALVAQADAFYKTTGLLRGELIREKAGLLNQAHREAMRDAGIPMCDHLMVTPGCPECDPSVRQQA